MDDVTMSKIEINYTMISTSAIMWPSLWRLRPTSHHRPRLQKRRGGLESRRCRTSQHVTLQHVTIQKQT